MGIASNRDAWVYNSSKVNVSENMLSMINFYNEQVEDYKNHKPMDGDKLSAKDFIDKNPSKISWSSSLIPKLENGLNAIFQEDKIFPAHYRPFTKQYLYYGEKMIHRRSQSDFIYPIPNTFKTRNICIPGIGVTKDFSCLMTNGLTDMELVGKNQCFPLHYYEERQKSSPGLFDSDGDSEFIRRDGISDFILERARKVYGKNVSKEDIFYYVYGILHNQDYRTAFENDLKKMLPRLPLVEDVRDFWKFSKSGRQLAELHINYEEVEPLDSVKVQLPEANLQMDAYEFYSVEKMRFPKKDIKHTINYNSRITISNIPEKAYEYVVNGKSAIEWIMERYQIKVDKNSGIKNDPNDWSRENEKPSYILDLLLSIINVSVQTVDIVNDLPKIKFD
ncbi:hypothetical protein E1140_02115 [Fulvivirga lutimaris]|nr:hypothetical protein [Fulvivirga lutimaris]